MKKIILILLTLFITFFATAKNKDDAKANTVLAPGAPTLFQVAASGNYWNSTTFTWSAPTTGGAVTYYTIYLKRQADVAYTKVNQSIASTTRTYTLTDAQMPMPMDYELYITATSGTEESAQSTHIFYPANQTVNPPGIYGINSTSVTSQGFTQAWLASTSSDIVGYFVFANGIPVGFSSASPCVVTGLNPVSTYSVTVAAMNKYGDISVTQTPNTVTTLNYCAPPTFQADCYTSQAYIQQVQITNGSANTLSYPSLTRGVPTTNTYNNFTTSVTAPALQAGSTNNVLKVRAVVNGANDANVAAFIDFDNDGVFEPTELVTMGGLTYKGSGGSSVTFGVPVTFVSNGINVPANADVGTVRMRIIYQRYPNGSTYVNVTAVCNLLDSATNDPNFTALGEIEDFTINITAPAATTARSANPVAKTEKIVVENTLTTPDPTNLIIYPNPVSGDFMNITAIDNNTPYAIYNTVGQEVSNGKVNNSTINVAKLAQGSYLLQVQVNDKRIVKQFIKQ